MGAGVAGVFVPAWLGALCYYDVRDRRLPNWLTIPGAVVILAGAVAVERGMPATLGAISLFAVYLTVHLLAPAAMGAGDVKLAIGVGALTGAFGVDVWLLASLIAPVLTAIWAVAATILRAESTVPHGPSMCIAATAAVALVLV